MIFVDLDIVGHWFRVRERVALYPPHRGLAVEQVRRCARASRASSSFLDSRGEGTMYVTNRFTVYDQDGRAAAAGGRR